jgi:DNA-directed RNA polymerase specialized sigma24 family protein
MNTICSTKNNTIDWLDVSRKIATRLKKTFPWLEWDDLVGTASLAVEEANNKYDENRSHDKNKLPYLYSKGYYLSIDILRATKAVFRTRRNFAIYNETTLRNFTKSQKDKIGLSCLKEIGIPQEHSRPKDCEDLLSGLTERQKAILRLKYNRGFSFIKIAEYLNMSNAWACKIHQDALIKLRDLRSDLKDYYE